MAETTSGILKLPRQDLETFEHFKLDQAGATAWVESLPSGDALKSAGMLGTVLSDLNRVALTPPVRFTLLEVIRGPLSQITAALTQAFLGDITTISENAQLRASRIAELHELGAAGYSLVAVETIRSPNSILGTNPARLACESLQRAIHFCGLEMLQFYLLYKPPLIGQWAMLHHLYALAERQQLAKLPVRDPVTGSDVSIASEYLPVALLGTCKVNQLRQYDIIACYRALMHWHDLVHIEDPEVGRGLFVVDLASDHPPDYSHFLESSPGSSQRFINTEALVKRLHTLCSRAEMDRGLDLDRNTHLDRHLLEHMERAIGEISKRGFNRQASRHQLWIATGLTSVHYFVAGERRLDHVLHGDDYVASSQQQSAGNPFMLPNRGDRWQRANPEEDSEEHEASPESALGVDVDEETLARGVGLADTAPSKHTVFTVESANISPGGYCVEWSALPDGINIGDVVCLREQAETNADWSIAVIRWISQTGDASTLIGLELLSPRGTAYAAQVKRADGSYSPPIRVILIPEIPLVGQPNTLLAPRLVFKENQKVILARKNETFLIQLNRRIGGTAAFGQFDFTYRRQMDDNINAAKGNPLHASQFESIWSDI